MYTSLHNTRLNNTPQNITIRTHHFSVKLRKITIYAGTFSHAPTKFKKYYDVIYLPAIALQVEIVID